MTRKNELVNFLSENVKRVKDKSLKDRINYTLKAFKKDEKSVAVLDLRAIAKEIDSLLTAPAATVETSIKKPTTASKSKLRQSKSEAKTETKETEAKSSAPKKTLKKSSAPKTEVKKPETVEKFPETLDLKNLRLKKLPVKDFNALYKALEALDADERIYFAAEWTPEQLKECEYSGNLTQIQKPKSFKFNLDILSVLYLGDNNTLGIAVSEYTDMPYIFNPEEVKSREMNGIPFEIYEAV